MLRLNREQVRRVDRLSVERYSIPGIVLMENASRGVADVACEMLGTANRVLIVCGGGNNGGDGLAAARHLHNRRKNVRIVLTVEPEQYQNEALVQWQIVSAMKIPIARSMDGEGADLVIDAIFGTGLTRPPREPFDRTVAAIHAVGARVLAVDIPSGLDCDTGRPLGNACVRAERTVTFVAEKQGFANPEAGPYVGRVIVADIGAPSELIEEISHT